VLVLEVLLLLLLLLLLPRLLLRLLPKSRFCYSFDGSCMLADGRGLSPHPAGALLGITLKLSHFNVKMLTMHRWFHIGAAGEPPSSLDLT
jgi:hypothetical protein